MNIENKLIIDIIERAPINSNWEFTYSWDKIEVLLEGRGVFNHEAKVFSTILNKSNKMCFDSILKEYNLSDWIVHQIVKSNSNEIIFEGFDHLSFSFISSDFPESRFLLAKYSSTDLLDLM
jgi:hypothetical protein